ncbi:MAG: fuconate dehydratase, partial [Nocardioidaceae bacterium]
CELVQHLSIFDYVVVSGTLEDRVTEYVDHLHEHFTDPCVVRDGAYRLPVRPGYSAEMKAVSVTEFAFPQGRAWSGDASVAAVGAS